MVGLDTPRTSFRLVHLGTSYKELAADIKRGKVDLKWFRILVLAIGRADVIDRNASVQQSLMAVREVVNEQDPAIIMLVCTPLPWPLDGSETARKLYRTSLMLKEFCQSNTTLQYARFTQDLVTLQGVNQDLITEDGLTKHAIELINRLLLGKIECGQLRQEYLFLCYGGEVA